MLAGLGASLHAQPELYELAGTPLMLSVMSVAFSEQARELHPTQADTRWLWNGYLRTMFIRRGHSQLKPLRTMQSLRWLAEQMVVQSQAVFYLERIHRAWFPEVIQKSITLAVRALFGMLAGLVLGVGLLFDRGITTAPIIGPIVGLNVGLCVGFAAAMLSPFRGSVSDRASTGLYGILYSLITGLTFGLTRTLVVGPVESLIDTLIPWSLTSYLMTTLYYSGIISVIVIIIYQLTLQPGSTYLVERLGWSWPDSRRGFVNGGFIGLASGLFSLLFLTISTTATTPLQMTFYGIAYSILFTIVGAVLGGMTGGLTRGEIESRVAPNQGIIRSARYAFFAGMSAGVVSLLGYAAVNWLIPTLGIGPPLGRGVGFLIAIGMTFTLAMAYGGLACLYHFVMRLYLMMSGALPWNLQRFLDACAERALLRRVGGGYIFIHRLLMEHFAALTDDDIARLSAAIDARRR